MKNNCIYSFLLYFVLLFTALHAVFGNDYSDRLLKLIQGTSNDTIRINALLDLGKEFKRKDPSKYFEYSADAFHRSVNLPKQLKAGTTPVNKDEKVTLFYFSMRSALKALIQCSLASASAGNYSRADQYVYTCMKISEKLSASNDSILSSIGKKYLINSYMQSGRIEFAKGHYDNALTHYKKSLDVSKKLNLKFNMADAHNNIASLYYSRGEFSKMLEHLNLSMKICEELNDPESLSHIYNNIGLFYDYQGNYNLALEYYLKSIGLLDSLENRKGLANTYLNIGIIHRAIGENEKALEYYGKCLKIYTEINDLDGLSKIYNSYGNIFSDQDDFVNSLRSHQKSLRYRVLTGNNRDLALAYTNIGAVLIAAHSKNRIAVIDSLILPTMKISVDNEFILIDSAEYYLRKAVSIQQKLDDKIGLAYSYNGLGGSSLIRQNYSLAFEYFNKAAGLSAVTGAKKEIIDALKGLSEAKKGMKEYKQALAYFEELKIMSDSLFNEENHKNLTRAEMRFEYEKKLQEQRIVEEKNKILSESEIKRQKIFRNYFIIVSFLILIVAFVLLNRYRIKKKANQKLSEQNTAILKQKELIESQKQDITDSIEYASRIQGAIMPSIDELQKHYCESFIIHRQRDVIGGDFYFITEVNDWKIIALADCTGHGVPGALMSMLGKEMLNEIVNDRRIITAGEVLDELTLRVTNALNPEKTGEVKIKEGMDIGFMAIRMYELQFAGARRPLLVFNNGNFMEYEGDDRSIGGDLPGEWRFKTLPFNVEKGAMLYLFTDGFADQFGGPKQKKFKTRNLIRLLSGISGKPVPEQKRVIEKTFLEWKGEYEQTDDVTVIGIKV